MILPGSDMYEFYKGEQEPESPTGCVPMVWEYKKSDICTSVSANLGKKAIIIGTQELCGCTVMAIISRTGVYLGHFWETMVFDIDDIWLKSPPVKTAEEWFKHTVRDGIRLGDAGWQTARRDFGKKISKSSLECGLIIT